MEEEWIANGDEISRGKGFRGRTGNRPSIVVYCNTNINTTTVGRGILCRARDHYLKLAAACLFDNAIAPVLRDSSYLKNARSLHTHDNI